MHAFILAHRDELAAFRAQVAALGATPPSWSTRSTSSRAFATPSRSPARDSARCVSTRVIPWWRAARPAPCSTAWAPRRHRILVSGDLDEYRIAALAGLAGRRIHGRDQTRHRLRGTRRELVYKLVAVADHEGPDAELRSVAKLSMGKLSQGGRKEAGRQLDADGRAVAELAGPTGALAGQADVRMLQVPLVRNGEPVSTFDLDAAKAHHQLAMAELSPEHLDLADGPPAFVLRLGNEQAMSGTIDR